MRTGDLLAARFRIGGHLARSRRGEVWRAHDEPHGVECEVEAVRVSGLDGEEALRLAAREVDIGARLDGRPGVLVARGYGVAEGGELWIARAAAPDASPLAVEGGDLLARVGRVAAAARAVAALHEAAVLHRDLGPGALLAQPDGRVVVAGLGLARLAGVVEPLGGSPLASLLVTTPACAAPEALERLDRVTPRADVHALGALLFRALCGAWPWGASLVEVVRAQERARGGPAPRPGAVNPEVPAALDTICGQALELEPGARLGSPAALADLLDAWRAEVTAVTPAAGLPPEPPPPPPEPPPPLPDPLLVPEEQRRPWSTFEGLTASQLDGGPLDAGRVLVLDLPPRAVEPTVVSLRHLDVRGATCLLVDMARVAHLGGAQLEALTELLTLSERRGLPIALFRLARPVRQLLRIMELEPHLPPVLEAADATAALEELRARAGA